MTEGERKAIEENMQELNLALKRNDFETATEAAMFLESKIGQLSEQEKLFLDNDILEIRNKTERN